MTDTAASGLANGPPAPHGALRESVLHVCTSCRAPGWPREPRENRPGFRLYQELRATFHGSPLGRHVEVRSANCLSLCPRPCGIALSSPGAWTYLFGDQCPGNSARDIVECVSVYIGTSDGFMPRERRPKALRASILGRVPPTEAGAGASGRRLASAQPGRRLERPERAPRGLESPPAPTRPDAARALTGTDAPAGTPSGPIAGLAVSQGQDRTCCITAAGPRLLQWQRQRGAS